MTQKKELSIHEDFLNPQLFIRILKVLFKHNKAYQQDIQYFDRRHDSMILKILKDGNEFTIFVKTEETNEIKIVGEDQLILDFIRDIAVENAAVFCSELCECITDQMSKETLRENLRIRIKKAIDEAVALACQRTNLDRSSKNGEQHISATE